jgi:hypothetical protein
MIFMHLEEIARGVAKDAFGKVTATGVTRTKNEDIGFGHTGVG